MIQKLIDLKDWVKDRLEERTTWDGAMLVGVGLVILFFGAFVNWAAYVAIVYGLWTIWKSEW